MRIFAIHRKLLRELGHLKGQITTIALVLAGGLTCFLALRGTYASLDAARAHYYERYRFAHVFARALRAPESLAPRIDAIAGVSSAHTRIAKEVSLPIDGMARPAFARLLSLPDGAAPPINTLHVSTGRLPERGRDDEAAVLESFAAAHGLMPGDRLPAVINGKLRKLRIVGLAMSPEFVYAIRPGALVDDPKRYAVLWMSRRALAAAFQLEGAFNDVVLRLAPGASEGNVRARLDQLLAPYGSDGAIGRAQQLSNRILTQELSQLHALAGMVPAVFLIVAAFLINLVLGRLIRLQRGEIAALKALGYDNREVALHYLGFASVVLLPSLAFGILGGQLLGHYVFQLYAGLFRLPGLHFQLTAGQLLASVLVSGLATTGAALLAVRSAVRLPPAEAMRPPAPARYRRGLLDRLGIASLAGCSGLMVLREVQRRPLRTLSSALGIAGAIALMILGRFGIDSLDDYLLGTYAREQRQDLSVAFAEPVSPRAVRELGRLPGVLHAEGMRIVGVRARHEHRARDAALIGLPPQASLRQLLERSGRALTVPEGGVLLTKALGQLLGLQIGDRLRVELREGDRPVVQPIVLGWVDDTVGLQIYARSELVAALEHDLGAVSSVLLSIEPAQRTRVQERLRRFPKIVDVSDVREDVQRLRDMNGAAMDIWTLVSITLSGCIIFGVVYNNARISLQARSRDLGSLRVLGFSRAEVSSILIGGLALEVALAIPLGLWLGRRWAEYFMTSSLDLETIRWTVVVAPRTYVMAAMIALLAAAASALWVRRSLDRLDLIEVLKTRD